MRQPAVIYTGAVYGAFKRDRGAGIKTGLFMEERGNTWAVVWMHTIQRVSPGKRDGGAGVVVCLSTCMGVCLHFYAEKTQSDVCRVSEWECML